MSARQPPRRFFFGSLPPAEYDCRKGKLFAGNYLKIKLILIQILAALTKNELILRFVTDSGVKFKF